MCISDIMLEIVKIGMLKSCSRLLHLRTIVFRDSGLRETLSYDSQSHLLVWLVNHCETVKNHNPYFYYLLTPSA